MKCPTCNGTDLVMIERQNVEIDYCPKCRGVWLDRGELDKIIEKSLAQPVVEAAPQPQSYPGHRPYERREDWGKHGHRRKSWLSEIFD